MRCEPTGPARSARPDDKLREPRRVAALALRPASFEARATRGRLRITVNKGFRSAAPAFPPTPQPPTGRMLLRARSIVECRCAWSRGRRSTRKTENALFESQRSFAPHAPTDEYRGCQGACASSTRRSRAKSFCPIGPAAAWRPSRRRVRLAAAAPVPVEGPRDDAALCCRRSRTARHRAARAPR